MEQGFSLPAYRPPSQSSGENERTGGGGVAGSPVCRHSPTQPLVFYLAGFPSGHPEVESEVRSEMDPDGGPYGRIDGGIYGGTMAGRRRRRRGPGRRLGLRSCAAGEK